MRNRKFYHRQIFNYLILSIAFFIPLYGRVLPALIALMALNWLIEGSWLKTFPCLFAEPRRRRMFFFSAIYWIYLLGMIYTRNLNFGFFDLEIKLSLLVFPLVFATQENDENLLAGRFSVFLAFIGGGLAGCLVLLVHAILMFAQTGDAAAFYYTRFSWYMHASYIAMYLSFGVACIGYLLIEHPGSYSKKLRLALLAAAFIFTIFIVLLSSKAGLISVSLAIFSWFLVLIAVRKQYKTAFAVLLVSAFFLTGAMKLFPNASQRIEKAGKVMDAEKKGPVEPSESNSERIVIWRVCTEIIREHPVFGVGTGDIKDALIEKYKESGNTLALNQRLNAHNQYLQTFVALGIPGILILALVLILPLASSLRRKDFLYVIFLLIFMVNIAVESMLEVQAGVVYYAFFNAFLFGVTSHGSRVTGK